jgi:COMPASS component SWD3
MELNLSEVDSLVYQWLSNEGYHDVATVLQEEANLKIQSSKIPLLQVNKIKAAILDGDWVEVEKLCIKYSFKNHKSFLYAIYKQGYLELLEKQEYQKVDSILYFF